MPQLALFTLAASSVVALCLCRVVVAQDCETADRPPIASAAEVKLLIAKLGDASFAVREAATTRLAEMDVSIRLALQDAVKSRDAEVRSRARRILVIVNKRYFEMRLTSFIADVDGKQGLELPGWSRFQSIAGKDRSARELFVEMYRSEPRIVEATESKLESLNELFADRASELLQGVQLGSLATISNSSVAALVFAASDPQLKVNANVASMVSTLVFSTPFYSSLNGARREEFKKLLEAWVIRETDDTAVLMRNVSMALNQDLAAGRTLAKAALKKDNLPTHFIQQAMSLLARSGKGEDAVLLERFLKDESVLTHFNRNSVTHDVLKVCDYAMAMMIQLTGNNPRDFRDGPLRWNQGWNADQQTLAFSTEEDRKAALAKWNAWWSENKEKLGKPETSEKNKS